MAKWTLAMIVSLRLIERESTMLPATLRVTDPGSPSYPRALSFAVLSSAASKPGTSDTPQRLIPLVRRESKPIYQ